MVLFQTVLSILPMLSWRCHGDYTVILGVMSVRLRSPCHSVQLEASFTWAGAAVDRGPEGEGSADNHVRQAVSSLPGQFSFLHACPASTINQDITIKRHFYSDVEMIRSPGPAVPAYIC